MMNDDPPWKASYSYSTGSPYASRTTTLFKGKWRWRHLRVLNATPHGSALFCFVGCAPSKWNSIMAFLRTHFECASPRHATNQSKNSQKKRPTRRQKGIFDEERTPPSLLFSIQPFSRSSNHQQRGQIYCNNNYARASNNQRTLLWRYPLLTDCDKQTH